MFMNEDTIGKKSLIYLKGKEYFIYDNQEYHFTEITHFFNISSLHVTNSVLEGKTQQLNLIFNEKDKLQLTIDSSIRNKEKYKTVYKLIQHIRNNRKSFLLSEYTKNECVSFKYTSDFLADDDTVFITIKNGQIYYSDKDNRKVNFQAEKVIIDAEETYIKLEGEGKKQVLSINKCSDVLLLLELIKQNVPHAIIPPSNPFLTTKMRWLLNITLILIGINGWGKFEFFDVPFLDGLSLFIGILVAVRIVTYPAFWLVGKGSMKRLKRIEDTELEALQEM